MHAIAAKSYMGVPLVGAFLPPLHEAKRDLKFEIEMRKCKRVRSEVSGNVGILVRCRKSLVNRGQNKGGNRS